MQVFHHKKICAIYEIFDPFEQKSMATRRSLVRFGSDFGIS
jgi:hypothetical protein